MQHRELQKTKNDAARGRGLPHLHISRGYRSRGGRRLLRPRRESDARQAIHKCREVMLGLHVSAVRLPGTISAAGHITRTALCRWSERRRSTRDGWRPLLLEATQRARPVHPPCPASTTAPLALPPVFHSPHPSTAGRAAAATAPCEVGICAFVWSCGTTVCCLCFVLRSLACRNGCWRPRARQCERTLPARLDPQGSTHKREPPARGPA